ncbi:unnamed protein product [Dovyalis caffra]|uniref:Uncharacterized protein n=1 Tax=Dovyalis caffra TaxID=77055 RepID=A0AAV1RCB0_9ROSI|nr:unnamed protein product [Dovyalis caffra]
MDHLGNLEPTTIFHVMALPFPGRGHINPMMNLCRSLASKNPDILITFVVTEEWLGLIGSEPKPDSISFGTIPNVLTSERARAGKFPAFFQEVLTKMEEPVEKLLGQLEPLVSTIIADTYLMWAFEMANRYNIPVASLWTMSVTVYSVFQHFDLLVQNGHFPIDLKERGEELVEYLPGISSTRIVDLPTCVYGHGRDILHRGFEAIAGVSKAQFLLFCSVYELESLAIDALKASNSLPIYHIGPTIPFFKLEQEEIAIGPGETNYFQWLDMQPKGSVLYVSQGSTHSASSAQLDEIAVGLRDSGVRYLWVARAETSLFKESLGDKGLIVPWCDQLRVLCHPSVGGFWSHCGWGSTSEVAFAGVPLLTFPLYWDQTPNSKLIVDDWKIGWRVKSGLDVNKLITRDEIAGLIKRFMDSESNEVKEMRRRAREVSEVCRRAIQKGGSSDTNINAFINDILQHQKQ